MIRAYDRFSGASPLPPQQAKYWAEKAIRGEADEQHGTMYVFKNKGGVKEIVLVSLDPPSGHITR